MPVQIFEPFGGEGTEEEQGLCYNPSLFSCLRKKSKILLPVEVYLQKKAIKKFNIPDYYRSSFTGRIKEWRQLKEGSGQNFAPTFLGFVTEWRMPLKSAIAPWRRIPQKIFFY